MFWRLCSGFVVAGLIYIVRPLLFPVSASSTVLFFIFYFILFVCLFCFCLFVSICVCNRCRKRVVRTKLRNVQRQNVQTCHVTCLLPHISCVRPVRFWIFVNDSCTTTDAPQSLRGFAILKVQLWSGINTQMTSWWIFPFVLKEGVGSYPLL